MVDKNNKWVLVTGGAGFIGSHVCEALLKRGRNVLVIDNFDQFYSKEKKDKNLREISRVARQGQAAFQFIETDILDITPASFDSFPLESVIHLAGKAGVRPSLEDPDGYFRANVTGTLRVLDLAVARKNLPVIFGSSSSVYGNDSVVPFSENQPAVLPISPYAATKRSAELICATNCHLYGLKIAMLRFFTVFGPRQRPDLAIHKFAKLIEDEKPITLFGNGKTSRDYTYCDDIVRGVLAAESWLRDQPAGTCEIFNLGGSQPVSLLNLVEALELALDKKAKIKWEDKQPGDVERTFADITKAAQKLGYAPQIQLHEGLKSFVSWMRTK
ncbi:MAG: NAD-dependent epimerase/dehydratase family protein [Proteobacteria bacterium]|nr:NAD-dependent epimerase/dehydratase family protein [Pseudomonadota bacterium]